jgi:prepilin-type N-terminal cleavage/methylation domain-containing protein
MNIMPAKQSGFTLIELLIVIVILGIIAGTTMVVINPAAQRDKAHETVLWANVDKLYLAQNACIAARQNPGADCASADAIGVELPNGQPLDSTIYNVVGRDAGLNSYVYVLGRLDGTWGDCYVYYLYYPQRDITYQRAIRCDHIDMENRTF